MAAGDPNTPVGTVVPPSFSLGNLELFNLGLLPSVYVPRSYVHAGGPFVPLQHVSFDPAGYVQGLAVFQSAAIDDLVLPGLDPTAGEGVSLLHPQVGHVLLGLAMATVAIASGGRLPAIPQQWREVKDAQRVGGARAQIPGSHAQIVISPGDAGTPGDADAHRKLVLQLGRHAIAALSYGKSGSLTKKDGVSYTESVDFTLPAPGPEKASLVAPILLTLAVVGAIGISQYFKAEVETKRLYFEHENVVPLAGVMAAVQLELARIKAEAASGNHIEPSPLAVSVAKGMQERIAKLPEGPGNALRIGGGIAGGVGLAVGAGYLAKKLRERRERRARA